MSHEMVINEARLMCCGQPRGECTCKTIRNDGKPQPIPQTDWQAIFNADAGKVTDQPKPQQQTTNRSDGKPTPLGHPVWNW